MEVRHRLIAESEQEIGSEMWKKTHFNLDGKKSLLDSFLVLRRLLEKIRSVFQEKVFHSNSEMICSCYC